MSALPSSRRFARYGPPSLAVALALAELAGAPASALADAAPAARSGAAPTPVASPVPSVDPVWVGRFTDGLAPWREIRLKPELRPNAFRRVDWDGAAAVEVRSDSAMSLLARPLSVDLAATPVLCWRWRVDAPLASADMARRAGDDYAARLYVSLRIPESDQGLALRAQLGLARAIWGPEVPDAAINYVWDNRHPVGTERPNAYTDRAVMVVQRTGAVDAGRWVWERRDVRSDAARLFGPAAAPVQLAVTADTDNTGESARAGFADLHFVAAGAPCVGRP
jgi:hypothetical protein